MGTIRYLLKVKETRRKTAMSSLQDPSGRCLTEIKHKLPRPSLEIPLSARNTLLTAPHLMTHLCKFDLTNSNSSLAPSISSQQTTISSFKSSIKTPTAPLLYRGNRNAAGRKSTRNKHPSPEI